MLLIMTSFHGWHIKQLYYVTTFPQVPVERELYMNIYKGVNFQGKISCDHVIKLHRNTYGQKNDGRVQNQYLVKKLKNIGFNKSKIDECVFYKGKVIYALYADDSILVVPDPDEIGAILKPMRKAKLYITEKGILEIFLRVNIDKQLDGTIYITQPHLIYNKLGDLNLLREGIKSKQN